MYNVKSVKIHTTQKNVKKRLITVVLQYVAVV